jgi:hypothetical protein
MTCRRMLGFALPAAAAASVIGIGAGAFAASNPARTNYRGPARRAALGLPGRATNRQPARAPSDATTSAARPAAANLHYLSIDASAFAPDGLHNTSEDYFNLWDPTTLSNQDDGRCFNTA